MACRILVPQSGIEPAPLGMEVWSLNHWTAREVPQFKETKQILQKAWIKHGRLRHNRFIQPPGVWWGCLLMAGIRGSRSPPITQPQYFPGGENTSLSCSWQWDPERLTAPTMVNNFIPLYTRALSPSQTVRFLGKCFLPLVASWTLSYSMASVYISARNLCQVPGYG